MRVFDIFRSAGLFLPSLQKIVWLFTDARQVEVIYPVVDAALRERPGYRLIITVPSSDLAELRRRFPHEEILPHPSRYGYARWRRFPNSALQIFGSRSAHPLVSAPDSLVVDGDSEATSIVRLLPEDIPTNHRAPAWSFLSCLTKATAGDPIGTIDDLSHRLGRAQDILCLGNGPSSEDPRLKEVSYDCLFRVNWIWRERSLYMSPNLVFTADWDFPSGTPEPVIGFPNEAVGLPILRYHALMLRPPRQGYTFVNTLLPILQVRPRGVVPSNGALMIGLAAALNPRRIIISGIDLYAHDDGRYPGDVNVVDGYSRAHSRASDLAFIKVALSGYVGEVKILSDNLLKGLGRVVN